MKTEKAQLVSIPSCFTVENPPYAHNADGSIEYSGLVWQKYGEEGSFDYKTTQRDCGRYRIHQYLDEGFYQGRWFWECVFDNLVAPEYMPSVLYMSVSGIEDTIEESMQACIEAKKKFIADIKTLSMALGVGDYATGFADGQSTLAKKIAEALP